MPSVPTGADQPAFGNLGCGRTCFFFDIDVGKFVVSGYYGYAPSGGLVSDQRTNRPATERPLSGMRDRRIAAPIAGAGQKARRNQKPESACTDARGRGRLGFTTLDKVKNLRSDTADDPKGRPPRPTSILSTSWGLSRRVTSCATTTSDPSTRWDRVVVRQARVRLLGPLTKNETIHLVSEARSYFRTSKKVSC